MASTGVESRSELVLFARKVLIVFALAVAVLLVWRAREVVLMIFIAAILAAGIAPAVRRVQAWARLWFHRRIRRGTAVLIVYFPFVATAVVGAIVGIPVVLAESEGLLQELPVVIEERILKPLQPYLPIDELRELVVRNGPELPVFGYLLGAVTVMVGMVAVLFMIVYMLIDAERLRNLFLLFYPAEERAQKRRMIRRMSRRMSSWLGAQLLLAAVIGVATFIVLVFLGIPYAVPLALIAAVGEMIPVLGPIVGAIPVLIVAATQSPWQFWAALVAAILIQQVENYFLVPRVMSRRVAISPLAVFVAFLFGASVFGIVGRDGGHAARVAKACVIVPVVSPERVTLHTEGICSVVWHLLVGHPALNRAPTKWESIR
ncbi:MAG TPA: AI-2E family transporter [Thermoanaerobaculia bacterium]|nr:AI-2E family transporter [Thermoanaerobaculia bacterium]